MFRWLILIFIISSCARNGLKKEVSSFEIATLYMHSAAELRALRYQAFNIAKERLFQMKNIKTDQKKAVILDIDETVLDNGPYQVENILNQSEFDHTLWRAWVDRAVAPAVPGASDFLEFASKHGYEIIYITNRREATKQATFENLKKLNLPVKLENMYFRIGGRSKKERRTLVAKKYKIVALLGDNLGDFSHFYDEKKVSEREMITDQLKREFGGIFIVFPNTMYGDWLDSVYKYKNSLDFSTKAKLRIEAFVQ